MKKLQHNKPLMIDLGGRELELNLWEGKDRVCEFSLFDGDLPVMSGSYDPSDEDGSLDRFLEKVNKVNKTLSGMSGGRSLPEGRSAQASSKLLSVRKVGNEWRRVP